MIDGSIVARLVGVPDDNRDYRLSGFNLGMGHGNTIRNSTAVGTGGTAGSAGFGWPEDAGQNLPGNGVWTFNQGNVSHNNHDDGLFAWQNTDTLHDVSNFVSYHNGSYGIEHGAYINSYRYADAILYGNGKAGINTKAKPKPMRPLSFENLIVDGGGSSPNGLVSFDHVADDDPLPTLFFCTVFKGQTGAAVGLSTGSEHQAPEIIDFVESQLSGTQFSMKNLLAGTRIRVQNGATAFQLDAGGSRTAIGPFVTVKGGCQPGPTSPPGLPPGRPRASTGARAVAGPDDHPAGPADHPTAAAGPLGPAPDHRPGPREHGQRRGAGLGERRWAQRRPPRRPLARRGARAGRLPRAVPVRLDGVRPAGRVAHPAGDPCPHRRHHGPLGTGRGGDDRSLTDSQGTSSRRPVGAEGRPVACRPSSAGHRRPTDGARPRRP
jgi:hypothetical protein